MDAAALAPDRPRVGHYFQPLFIARYAFAPTVDFDFGREVPDFLRRLMLPTNEFFFAMHTTVPSPLVSHIVVLQN